MDDRLLEMLRPFAKMVAEELARMAPRPEISKAATSEQYRGVAGIATIFQCSRSKAQRLKNSGKLDKAIIKIGSRAFIVDKDKAIAAMSSK